MVREMHRTCSLIVESEYLICASSSYLQPPAPGRGFAPHGASQGRERKFHPFKLGFNQALLLGSALGSNIAGR